LIVSMSWGWPEPDQCQIVDCSNDTSFAYVTRTNTEFMKLGQKGVTLLAASGDQGAPGDENPFCQSDTLSTIFPGASPWVTSVGATMLASSSKPSTLKTTAQPPICQQVQCPTVTTETVCTYPGSLITTGGGFSDYSTRPTWQTAAVQAYFKSGVKLPPTKYYNNTNRGFPDVAANGHAYLIAYAGNFLQVDGTSCSSPVFAANIALLNGYLLDNNKPVIGFANPLLYKMWAADKTSFTDITSGDNSCTESCCTTYGFQATTGWDPVTGLGTPNFARMLNYLKTHVVKKN